MRIAAKDLSPGDRITLRFTADSVEKYHEHDFVSVGNAESNLNLNVDPDTRVRVRLGAHGRMAWAVRTTLRLLTGHR